jgi:hypothetical protein
VHAALMRICRRATWPLSHVHIKHASDCCMDVAVCGLLRLCGTPQELWSTDATLKTCKCHGIMPRCTCCQCHHTSEDCTMCVPCKQRAGAFKPLYLLCCKHAAVAQARQCVVMALCGTASSASARVGATGKLKSYTPCH